MNFTQCHLTKSTGFGTTSRIVWISSDLAIAGNLIKLKTRDGYERGWVVVKCYEEISEEQLDRSNRFSRHASFVSDFYD